MVRCTRPPTRSRADVPLKLIRQTRVTRILARQARTPDAHQVTHKNVIASTTCGSGRREIHHHGVRRGQRPARCFWTAEVAARGAVEIIRQYAGWTPPIRAESSPRLEAAKHHEGQEWSNPGDDSAWRVRWSRRNDQTGRCWARSNTCLRAVDG